MKQADNMTDRDKLILAIKALRIVALMAEHPDDNILDSIYGIAHQTEAFISNGCKTCGTLENISKINDTYEEMKVNNIFGDVEL
jgi:hypothetical protein